MNSQLDMDVNVQKLLLLVIRTYPVLEFLRHCEVSMLVPQHIFGSHNVPRFGIFNFDAINSYLAALNLPFNMAETALFLAKLNSLLLLAERSDSFQDDVHKLHVVRCRQERNDSISLGSFNILCLASATEDEPQNILERSPDQRLRQSVE